jgi:hypothetical protein
MTFDLQFFIYLIFGLLSLFGFITLLYSIFDNENKLTPEERKENQKEKQDKLKKEYEEKQKLSKEKRENELKIKRELAAENKQIRKEKVSTFFSSLKPKTRINNIDSSNVTPLKNTQFGNIDIDKKDEDILDKLNQISKKIKEV